MKYGTKKFSPHHINSVLVESWYAFKMSSRKIIRDIFAKTKLPPHSPPDFKKNPGMCCLHTSIFWSQFWRNKQYITPYSCAYWVPGHQDWWSYGFTPRKGYAKIIKENYYPSWRVWRCEKNNSNPYSRYEEIMHGDNKPKEVDIGKMIKPPRGTLIWVR